MNDESDVDLQSELIRLRDSNAELNRKVLALADANAYAAELLAALEEAQEREAKLVRRGEELDLQTRLDLVMQQERVESRLVESVASELIATGSTSPTTASLAGLRLKMRSSSTGLVAASEGWS